VLILRKEKIIDNDNIIGSNIRRIRLEKGIGQTELVKQLQLMDVDNTRETLVKIESGRQHVKLNQLNALKKIFKINYDLILEDENVR
jgi:transcriptional regulator with XRE-family HTH domain